MNHLPKQEMKYFFHKKILKKSDDSSSQYANNWHQVELSSTLYVQYVFHSGEVSEHVGNTFQLSFELEMCLFVRVFCFCNQLCPGKRLYRCIFIESLLLQFLTLRSCNSLELNRQCDRRLHGHAIYVL